MKILVAPTFAIGKYWADKMQLRKDEYVIITNETNFRGKGLCRKQFYFIENEPFGYPEYASEKIAKEFTKFCEFVETVIKDYPYEI